MSNNAANSRYEDGAVFGERKKRTPAYEAKIAAATKELYSYVDIETEARCKSEKMAAKFTGELRQRADRMDATVGGLCFVVICLVAAVIYLWVTR